LTSEKQMLSARLCDLASLAAMIPHGAKLALPSENSGVAMSAARELIRGEVRGLHLVCVPVGGIQTDILIGAGLVATVETSAVTLGEFGSAPRFTAAMNENRVRVIDATCPAIHAALQAAQKGIPFIPLRGLIGTDVLANHPDWKVIDNPFQSGDPIVLLSAIQPDIALFHAPLADRDGNVFIGRWRELLTLAHAARRTLVTVEEITDRDLMGDPDLSAGVIPALYITAIAKARHGAWPVRFGDYYSTDQEALGRYAAAARTDAGFRDWLHEWLAAQPTEVLA
jgi:glutaconate CoA-transferase subunit A